MPDLEPIIKTDETFDRIIKEANEYTKKCKGYMYDSLCYRYQLARYKACEADAIDLVMTKGMSKREAEAMARKACERDCLRFYQILDEAIGEHD